MHVERVSIRDALGGLSGLKRGGLSSLWSKVELIEPTFQVQSTSKRCIECIDVCVHSPGIAIVSAKPNCMYVMSWLIGFSAEHVAALPKVRAALCHVRPSQQAASQVLTSHNDITQPT